jgi:hypothetical protein
MVRNCILTTTLISILLGTSAAYAQTPMEYEITVSAGGGSADGTIHSVWVQLYSDELEQWGSWHELTGEIRPGQRRSLRVREVAGFIEVRVARIYVPPSDPARLALTVYGSNGTVSDFRESQTVSGMTDYAIPEPDSVPYWCPDWSTKCACFSASDCADLLASDHCAEGTFEEGTCFPDGGSGCGTCTNQGGHCEPCLP